MNREIKFRVWDKKINKYDNENISIYSDGEIFKANFKYYEIDFDCVTKDVVIEQFTGLTDKNGVEIYEGDILRFSNKLEWYANDIFEWHLTCKTQEELDNKIQELKTNHKLFPYEERVIEIPNDYEWLLSNEIQKFWEVIGNIHE